MGTSKSVNSKHSKGTRTTVTRMSTSLSSSSGGSQTNNNNGNKKKQKKELKKLTGSTIIVIEDESAASRLSNMKARAARQKKEEHDRAAAIVPYLANRSYHLPNNGCCADWIQYFTNNHPVLGLCCHHKLHPIKCCKRIIVLIGSIASGLAIANLFYLYFLYKVEGGVDGEFASIALRANITISDQTVGLNQVSFTNYQVSLWTLGAAMHSTLDLLVWYITACGCCQPGGILSNNKCCANLKWIGSYIVVFAVIIIAAAASFAIVLRATLEREGLENVQLNSTDIFFQAGRTGVEDYEFLIAWCIELILALFVYHFIIGTIFFSGCLGCGRLPVLGGRPREVYLEERKQMYLQLRRQETNDSSLTMP